MILWFACCALLLQIILLWKTLHTPHAPQTLRGILIIIINRKEIMKMKKADVVVIGGSAAGITAAVASVWNTVHL